MTIPDPDYLLPEQVMVKVINAVVGVYEASGVDLPARRVWAVEGAAVDCEQVTFIYDQIYKGLPGDDPNSLQPCSSPRTLNLAVQLWRCAPKSKDGRALVPIAEKEEWTRTLMRDGWLLLDAAYQIDNEAWHTGILAEVTVTEPSDYVASILTLAVPI